MEAVICRTSSRSGSGSIPVPKLNSPTLPRVSSLSLPVHDSIASGDSSSPSISAHIGRRSIRRVSSMPSRFGSRSFADKIPEEEESIASLTLLENRRHTAIPVEELGFPGGGIGKNWNSCGGAGGGSSDGSSIGFYYEQMLRSYPTNALLLRNYGKYLHEVEKNYVKAEEFYRRAILASPGDGEVLSLYGKLIWETQRDENRAKYYFDQAVIASPDDWYEYNSPLGRTVLGSYAQFMWEANDEEEEEEEEVTEVMISGAVKTMVEAF